MQADITIPLFGLAIFLFAAWLIMTLMGNMTKTIDETKIIKMLRRRFK